MDRHCMAQGCCKYLVIRMRFALLRWDRCPEAPQGDAGTLTTAGWEGCAEQGVKGVPPGGATLMLHLHQMGHVV